MTKGSIVQIYAEIIAGLWVKSSQQITEELKVTDDSREPLINAILSILFYKIHWPIGGETTKKRVKEKEK